MTDPLLVHAAELVDQADALVVAAGAGIGVDSGLPDFRGDSGFWRAYPALGASGLKFTEVASPETFRRDPALAWGFYGHRLALYRRTVPHAGFGILRRWGERMARGLFVYTSNVDGQFQRAGYPADLIHECHGAIERLQCTRPCSLATWSADALVPDIDEAACRWRGPLPTCPHCGALARPAILMFGDSAWIEREFEQQASRLDAWLAGVRRPVVVELGAGTHIPSVRHFGQRVVTRHGGRLVRLNPRESAVPLKDDVGLPLGALAGLQAIDAVLAGLG
ncbi:SIR2 family NAD-dependent protein deacylase [Leptothrix sp. BB-4]